MVIYIIIVGLGPLAIYSSPDCYCCGMDTVVLNGVSPQMRVCGCLTAGGNPDTANEEQSSTRSPHQDLHHSPTRRSRGAYPRAFSSFLDLLAARAASETGFHRCQSSCFLIHCQVFGLPGLLCTVSQNSSEDRAPVEIYGPLGLRKFLRTALHLSRSVLGFQIAVHELWHDRKPEDIDGIVSEP